MHLEYAASIMQQCDDYGSHSTCHKHHEANHCTRIVACKAYSTYQTLAQQTSVHVWIMVFLVLLPQIFDLVASLLWRDAGHLVEQLCHCGVNMHVVIASVQLWQMILPDIYQCVRHGPCPQEKWMKSQLFLMHTYMHAFLYTYIRQALGRLSKSCGKCALTPLIFSARKKSWTLQWLLNSLHGRQNTGLSIR